MDVFDSESDQQLDLAEREEVLGELEKTINNLAQQVEKAPPDSESISHSHPDSINGGLLHSNGCEERQWECFASNKHY
ncbi:hypothetical protein SARC_02596 [Sphaeroforma arctica JP610]|uniref:Uncharacterized protein n=1 Tax=Sphaeroforma arctica JP610 TaxID=667725 RepID=A0A0L0G894_9EUKA|nr:hypothetical protein SARC_02596 [Sphaeroforma arctica JP610]KNC85220.1 hypothetical protein SARC_02596 [Sphaeroforma arctica JP610]|eukprot:XP_014159122.1 hypothetical protein SARC_02596 [Sphaeroforma arctica JP610]